MQEFFGIGPEYFSKSIRPLAKTPKEVQTINTQNWYHAPTILRTWKDRRVLPNNHNAPKYKRDGHEDAAAEDEDDPMMSAPASPTAVAALEKYRREKWLLARLDRRQKEGLLMSREAVHFILSAMAGVWRNACDAIQRRFGSDAHEILDDARVQMERTMEDAFVRLDEAAKEDLARRNAMVRSRARSAEAQDDG